MIRQGTYTASPSLKARVTGAVRGRWEWFRGLSTKKKLLYFGGPVLAFLILTPIITYLYFANVIADPDRLMNHNRTGVVIEDKDGEVFYSFGTAKDTEVIGLDKIADNTENALIATEDKDFYEHSGFSFTSMLAALWANLTSGDPTAYGGSTLTQQLVGSILLTSSANYFEKYQEIFLAVAIEQTYTKEEILMFYLNSAYFGEGAFGIKSAAETYFDKQPSELTLEESSMLIGLLPAPSAYSPISGDAEYAKERQDTVLSRMVDEEYITAEQKESAIDTELAYAEQEATNGDAPHFAQMILAEVYEEYGEERATRSGFTVRTTLDLEWQKAAQTYVEEQTVINAPNGGRNAALVAIDPSNGGIRALVGSSDYDNDKFGKLNMAITPRQPGSSFKPIYYTEALAEGIVTPATIIEDEPIDIGGYQPENFDFAYRGEIAVRDALAQSLNIPAVKVMEDVGVQEALDTADRMGISTLDRPASDYGLALALGAGEVKLTEMTNAYAAFANDGEQYDMTSIVSVEDKLGKQIFESDETPEADRVVDEGASFLISDILSDNEARAPTFGGALSLSRDTAVKTGSTDDNIDAWVMGFTPNVAVGVWVGNNEREEMSAGGSGMAGPIWSRMMERTFQDLESVGFEKPPEVDQIRVCANNGGRVIGDGTEGTYEEFFLANHPPEGECEREQPKDSDNDGVLDEDDECGNTPRGSEVDGEGCPVEEDDEEEDDEDLVDADGDGVPDAIDECAGTEEGANVNAAGCSQDQRDDEPVDTDGDGTPDDDDPCPDDPDDECDDDSDNGGGPPGQQSNQGFLLSRRTS